MKTVPEVLKEILKVRDGEVLRMGTGICTYIVIHCEIEHDTDQYDALCDKLGNLFIRWPHYSGVPSYPVPDPEKPNDFDAAIDIYLDTPIYRYLDGKYGELRLDLVQFLLDNWEE